MSDMQTIEIDVEVHKKIELSRTSFEEKPNDLLRKLLDLPPKKVDLSNGQSADSDGGRPWMGKGVTLPHSTLLRMEYNGSVYNGHIDNGRWNVEGILARSPSDAANSVAVTKDGRHTNLNGWNYWYAKRPQDRSWRPLGSFRKKS